MNETHAYIDLTILPPLFDGWSELAFVNCNTQRSANTGVVISEDDVHHSILFTCCSQCGLSPGSVLYLDSCE